MPERYYDLFISYARRDRPEWVEALAANLHQRGFELFLDAWEIGAALAIAEELGNRSGMAGSYHQLGRVAQQRGSYEEALDWYRKSLAIKEELGDRAGMASSISQIGVLFTKAGRAEEAVPWNLRSLGIRLQIQVPEIRLNLHWLGRQREALGEERFREILREHLDEKSAGNVLRMLEEPPGQE